MYQLNIIVLLSLFLLVSCNVNDSITDPRSNKSYRLDKQLEGYRFTSIPSDQISHFTKGLTNYEYGSKPNWIQLPEIKGLLKDAGYTTSKFVNADKDTELIMDHTYNGGIHGKVKIIVKLMLYEGTLNQDSFISMTVNRENGTITFEPSQEFNKDAELYVKFEGIDLTHVEEEDISFDFLGKNGSLLKIHFKEIIIDQASGTLELKEGKVPHFSRYGWTQTRK